MLIHQGRVWAASIEDAVEQIYKKYGEGVIHIWAAGIQPRKNLIWYEYNIITQT